MGGSELSAEWVIGGLLAALGVVWRLYEVERLARMEADQRAREALERHVEDLQRKIAEDAEKRGDPVPAPSADSEGGS